MSSAAETLPPAAPDRPQPPMTIIDAVRSHSISRPDDVALCDRDGVHTYGELALRVSEASKRLPSGRSRLAAVQMEPSVDSIVQYLAAMSAGYAVLLTADATAGSHDALDPDLIIAGADGPTSATPRPSGDLDHGVHPDLGVLLSTSGSTSSPKCVRLSHRALLANAVSICQYLSISRDDCAITSLPLHYSYGLSVLHSHLVAGASVVLTGTSVVDPCFWDLVDRYGVTSLAAVPHSIEMLERTSFLDRSTPSLRYITVAGGKLAPDRVERWALAGRDRGWKLFVMYGQTEATARMAYLPPDAATTSPESIGVAIPGGTLTIDRTDDALPEGVGEVVYAGPNVMMGYARTRQDLSLGATVAELRTGDLGRRDPTTGFIEVVGRTSRFIKPLSVRVDLDQVERRLADAGVVAACTGTDDELFAVIETTPPTHADQHRELVDALASAAGVPRGCCVVNEVDELPRRDNGKVDYAAVNHRQIEHTRASDEPGAESTNTPPVRACFEAVLGQRNIAATDTFASLGGDSLSFVEVSLRLERSIPHLPSAWHLMEVRELEQLVGNSRARASWWARVDTSIVIRAVSILAVVATHMELIRVPGGAHLMLAVAGYNFSRFQLSIPSSVGRLTSGLRTAARVGLPAAVWIGINMAIVGGYSLGTFLLLNDYTGSSLRTDGRWRYWFFEAFVKILLVATVVVAIPALRRLERRAPFGFALGMLAPLLVIRFELLQFGDPYNYGLRAHSVAWLFALGWAVHRASDTPQRFLVNVIAACSVYGFWNMPERELFVIVGLVVLTWWPEVRIPRALAASLGTLAAMSMWIYLFHPQVYPTTLGWFPTLPAYVATIAVCVVMGLIASRVVSGTESALSRRPRRAAMPLQGTPVGARLRTPQR